MATMSALRQKWIFVIIGLMACRRFLARYNNSSDEHPFDGKLLTGEMGAGVKTLSLRLSVLHEVGLDRHLVDIGQRGTHPAAAATWTSSCCKISIRRCAPAAPNAARPGLTRVVRPIMTPLAHKSASAFLKMSAPLDGYRYRTQDGIRPFTAATISGRTSSVDGP